jgi:hypothetical protein
MSLQRRINKVLQVYINLITLTNLFFCKEYDSKKEDDSRRVLDLTKEVEDEIFNANG